MSELCVLFRWPPRHLNEDLFMLEQPEDSIYCLFLPLDLRTHKNIKLTFYNAQYLAAVNLVVAMACVEMSLPRFVMLILIIK